jgi:Zn-dependent metalloprotease
VAAAAAMVASGFAASSAGAAPATAARTAGAMAAPLTVSQHAQLLADANAGRAAAAKSLGLGSQEKLVVKDVIKDHDGTVHTRYNRTFAGLPVLGGDLVVHQTKGGAVKDVTKATQHTITVASLTPKLAPEAASKSALATSRTLVGKKAELNSAPRKVIWAGHGTPVLAYETVVGGFQDDGTPSKMHVITDANTGKKLFQYQAVETGTGTSEYAGKVDLSTKKGDSGYELTDDSRGGHQTFNMKGAEDGNGTLFTNSSDTWGDGTPGNPETAAVDATYGAQLTWDYYKNVQGRSGIKGDGKGATSRVHYGHDYSNAFWDDSCFCMSYGDGEGDKKPLTAIDVAGHEMTHGVTSATAGLEYSGESGGLNESTSDIFGTAVEFSANNPTEPGNYLIGEKLDMRGDGSPLRYMDKPSKDGQSADNWSADVGGLDVHYSSGVGNHWFYLASEGSGAKDINGVHYDSPTADGSTVKGIGRDKVEKIWFKALTTYMTSTTDYKAARDASLKAATDLYGKDSDEYKGVDAAWAGVNVKG